MCDRDGQANPRWTDDLTRTRRDHEATMPPRCLTIFNNTMCPHQAAADALSFESRYHPNRLLGPVILCGGVKEPSLLPGISSHPLHSYTTPKTEKLRDQSVCVLVLYAARAGMFWDMQHRT